MSHEGLWEFMAELLDAVSKTDDPDAVTLLVLKRQRFLGLDDAGLEKGRKERLFIPWFIKTTKERQQARIERGDPKPTRKWSPSESAQILLDSGQNPNAGLLDTGTPPIHLAAANGDVEGIHVWLKAGARVNLRDEDGWTPLHYAAAEGKREAVGTLLRAGANVHAKTTMGSLAIDIARYRRDNTEGSVQPYNDVILILEKFAEIEKAPPARQRAPKPAVLRPRPL